ncbi:MAG TPA: PPC domain-containing DNA-binding protein [Patescibacteria group bacterium]|nr:PPC domain-containing DNA-binding protein [Patescibacteria group bacterium]
MFYQKIDRNTYIARMKRGERVIETLKTFFKKEKIVNAFFYGLGALDEVILAHYDILTKKYGNKTYRKPFELLNITGNVFSSPEDIIIHAHTTLADDAMQTLGGHFVEGTVSGTVELFIQNLPTTIKKHYDIETGLKLIALSKKI